MQRESSVSPRSARGRRVERVLELAHIALNKNTVPGDKSAMVPGGIRMGSPALTSRGFVEADFQQVADFVHRGISITKDLKSGCGARLRAGCADRCGAESQKQQQHR